MHIHFFRRFSVRQWTRNIRFAATWRPIGCHLASPVTIHHLGRNILFGAGWIWGSLVLTVQAACTNRTTRPRYQTLQLQWCSSYLIRHSLKYSAHSRQAGYYRLSLAWLTFAANSHTDLFVPVWMKLNICEHYTTFIKRITMVMAGG